MIKSQYFAIKRTSFSYAFMGIVGFLVSDLISLLLECFLMRSSSDTIFQ